MAVTENFKLKKLIDNLVDNSSSTAIVEQDLTKMKNELKQMLQENMHDLKQNISTDNKMGELGDKM